MSMNHLNQFKAKMAAGHTALGSVITFTDPAVSELAAEAGFDFTWIDMEHSPFSPETVMMHIMALRGTGCAPLVRVPWNGHGIIKPVLDMAPAGIIIPMVCSAPEAEAAVEACRYPPRGTRGCGMRRAVRYGAMPLAEYRESEESSPLVILQIEHIDAVRNLDAILQIPGIDSICIGPFDLSSSMKKMGQLDAPEVVDAIETVCAKTIRAGILLGAYGTDVELWLKRRVNWLSMVNDFNILFRGCREITERYGTTGK